MFDEMWVGRRMGGVKLLPLRRYHTIILRFLDK
jgi:hypothetical protein